MLWSALRLVPARKAIELADVRLAYFGVGATPLRARNAESALSDGDLERAIEALGSDLNPGDDLQADGKVKAHLAGVLLRRVASQLACGGGMGTQI